MSRIFFIEAGSGLGGFVGVNGGLVNEHDGNIVFYRIDSMALDTFQAIFICGEFYIRLAHGTRQNLKQLRVYHSRFLLNFIISHL